MQCTKLNGDLFKKSLINSPDCACGNANENASQFSMNVVNYRVHPDTLQSLFMGFVPFTIHTLLYDSKNCTHKENVNLFQAVHYL